MHTGPNEDGSAYTTELTGNGSMHATSSCVHINHAQYMKRKALAKYNPF